MVEFLFVHPNTCSNDLVPGIHVLHQVSLSSIGERGGDLPKALFLLVAGTSIVHSTSEVIGILLLKPEELRTDGEPLRQARAKCLCKIRAQRVVLVRQAVGAAIFVIQDRHGESAWPSMTMLAP